MKWLLVAVMVVLAVLGGLAYANFQSNAPREKAPVLKAGTSLYEQLMKDGKIVTNDIHFEYDRAVLKPQSMKIIEEIANMMKAHSEIKLSIHGHTDNHGSSSYNLELSDLRAAAVRQALLNFSIDASRLTSEGFGESQPVVSNDTDEGRAKNRRVEFVLIQ